MTKLVFLRKNNINASHKDYEGKNNKKGGTYRIYFIYSKHFFPNVWLLYWFFSIETFRRNKENGNKTIYSNKKKKWKVSKKKK